MSDTLAILNTVFGYPAFRDRQGAIIDHVTAGGDTLVLMPTASGKSLCYKIPALARNGVAIVVSPLIALMHDQVAALQELGIKAAYLIHLYRSTKHPRNEALDSGSMRGLPPGSPASAAEPSASGGNWKGNSAFRRS